MRGEDAVEGALACTRLRPQGATNDGATAHCTPPSPATSARPTNQPRASGAHQAQRRDRRVAGLAGAERSQASEHGARRPPGEDGAPPAKPVVGVAYFVREPARTMPAPAYSHSIVPGGLLVMSSTTRLTSRISLIMREAICSSRS
jgi:hypothetical protein